MTKKSPKKVYENNKQLLIIQYALAMTQNFILILLLLLYITFDPEDNNLHNKLLFIAIITSLVIIVLSNITKKIIGAVLFNKIKPDYWYIYLICKIIIMIAAFISVFGLSYYIINNKLAFNNIHKTYIKLINSIQNLELKLHNKKTIDIRQEIMTSSNIYFKSFDNEIYNKCGHSSLQIFIIFTIFLLIT